MAKKKTSRGVEMYQELQLLSKNEQKEFWVEVAAHGAWKETVVEMEIAQQCLLAYASGFYAMKHLEAKGEFPDNTTMNSFGDQVSSGIEKKAYKPIGMIAIIQLIRYSEIVLQLLVQQLGPPFPETDETVEAERQMETVLEKAGLPSEFIKDKIKLLVKFAKIGEARSKFIKKKNPENADLEKSIIDVYNAGCNKPKDIWNELKKNGAYAELPLRKVSKLKFKLKSQGRIV